MSQQISIRVNIDGLDAYDKAANLTAGQPTILDGLNFTWGRTAITDQPDQATASFTVRQRITGDPSQQTLFDALHSGSLVQIFSTDPTSGREVQAWAGEVTTSNITPAGKAGLQATVQCADPSSTLANTDVGADPWPEETAGQRFQHILDAAGLRLSQLRAPGWQWTLTGQMDATLQNIRVAFRDVDSQPALDLIQSLAETVGGIAWLTADDNGPYVWLEDPTNRQGLRQFIVDPTTNAVTVGQISLDFDSVNKWDSDDVIPSDATWTEDPSQSINVIDVAWQQPDGVSDDGNPAYNAVVAEQVDTDSDKGIHTFDVTSDMVRRPDATMLAYRWLLQAHSGDWIVSRLLIDAGLVLNRANDPIPMADRITRLMDLLDMKLRIGYRLTVTNLPTWAPGGREQSFYIEGGTYTWVGGRWQLQLTATANAIGGSAEGRDFNNTDVTFADFDANLRFIDIADVAAPGGFPVGFGVGPFGVQPFGA